MAQNEGVSNSAENSQGKSKKAIFEIPKDIESLRSHTAEWSLADDAGLLHVLEEFSTRLKSDMRTVEKSLDELVYETRTCHIALRNTFTSFSMLSNKQFVENRVYEEDIEDTKTAQAKGNDLSKLSGPGSKRRDAATEAEERQEVLVPKYSRAISCSYHTLRRRIRMMQDEGPSGTLQSSGKFASVPLPYAIGSARFLDAADMPFMAPSRTTQELESSSSEDEMWPTSHAHSNNNQDLGQPVHNSEAGSFGLSPADTSISDHTARSHANGQHDTKASHEHREPTTSEQGARSQPASTAEKRHVDAIRSDEGDESDSLFGGGFFGSIATRRTTSLFGEAEALFGGDSLFAEPALFGSSVAPAPKPVQPPIPVDDTVPVAQAASQSQSGIVADSAKVEAASAKGLFDDDDSDAPPPAPPPPTKSVAPVPVVSAPTQVVVKPGGGISSKGLFEEDDDDLFSGAPIDRQPARAGPVVSDIPASSAGAKAKSLFDDTDDDLFAPKPVAAKAAPVKVQAAAPAATPQPVAQAPPPVTHATPKPTSLFGDTPSIDLGKPTGVKAAQEVGGLGGQGKASSLTSQVKGEIGAAGASGSGGKGSGRSGLSSLFGDDSDDLFGPSSKPTPLDSKGSAKPAPVDNKAAAAAATSESKVAASKDKKPLASLFGDDDDVLIGAGVGGLVGKGTPAGVAPSKATTGSKGASNLFGDSMDDDILTSGAKAQRPGPVVGSSNAQSKPKLDNKGAGGLFGDDIEGDAIDFLDSKKGRVADADKGSKPVKEASGVIKGKSGGSKAASLFDDESPQDTLPAAPPPPRVKADPTPDNQMMNPVKSKAPDAPPPTTSAVKALPASAAQALPARDGGPLSVLGGSSDQQGGAAPTSVDGGGIGGEGMRGGGDDHVVGVTSGQGGGEVKGRRVGGVDVTKLANTLPLGLAAPRLTRPTPHAPPPDHLPALPIHHHTPDPPSAPPSAASIHQPPPPRAASRVSQVSAATTEASPTPAAGGGELEHQTLSRPKVASARRPPSRPNTSTTIPTPPPPANPQAPDKPSLTPVHDPAPPQPAAPPPKSAPAGLGGVGVGQASVSVPAALPDPAQSVSSQRPAGPAGAAGGGARAKLMGQLDLDSDDDSDGLFSAPPPRSAAAAGRPRSIFD